MSLTASSSTPAPWSRDFSRRTLLAASAAGVALLAVGCTSSPGGDEGELVTSEQADSLADQVAAQVVLVDAVAAAGAADPALAAAVADLTSEASAQLQRLRAAAPGGTTSPAPSTAAGPPSPADARAWLRAQVAATATSHATACLDQSGGRAALLGSIAAGLRGHDGRLA